jgi:hypothetical protein
VNTQGLRVADARSARARIPGAATVSRKARSVSLTGTGVKPALPQASAWAGATQIRSTFAFCSAGALSTPCVQ